MVQSIVSPTNKMKRWLAALCILYLALCILYLSQRNLRLKLYGAKMFSTPTTFTSDDDNDDDEYKEIADRRIAYRKGSPIPRVLHYTWPNKDFEFETGKDPDGTLQKSILDTIDIIRTSNPGWQVYVWTDKECYDFMETYFSNFMKEWGNRMTPRKFWDIVRIAILYVHGGIYLDHDFQCKAGTSFDQWTDNQTELLLIEGRQKLFEQSFFQQKLFVEDRPWAQGNYFMGSAPGHPFWKIYWKNIVELMPGDDIWVLEHTGPRQLHHSFSEYINSTQAHSQSVRLLKEHECTTIDQVFQCLENKRKLSFSEEFRNRGCRTRCVHSQTISPAELIENNAAQSRKHLASLKWVKGYEKSPCDPCSRPVTARNQSGQNKTIVFVHIPKNGGTSVERHLNMSKVCHVRSTAIQQCDETMYSKALSFGIIRHPVQRAISMYYDTRQGGNGAPNDRARYAWVQNISFPEFAVQLAREKSLLFTPQSYFVLDFSDKGEDNDGLPPLSVDRVLCLENLGSEWQDMIEAEGIDEWTVQETAGKINRFFNQTVRVSEKDGSATVDAFSLEILKEAYGMDFSLWNKYCGKSAPSELSNLSVPITGGEKANFLAKTKPAKDRIAWFLHFHKAGGSSFVDLAIANDETVRDPERKHSHSHLELDNEEFRWGLVAKKWGNYAKLPKSCIDANKRKGGDEAIHFARELERIYRAENVSFVSTEHWFPGATHILGQVSVPTKIVAVFREPMDRLESSYYFHTCGAGRCSRENNTCGFSEWIMGENNMHVRTLNGLPFGPMKIGKECSLDVSRMPLKKTHYNFAKRSVSAMDLVLTLETIVKRPKVSDCLLKKVLGWDHTRLPHVHKTLDGMGSKCAKPDKSEWKKARSDNAFDMELYGYVAMTEMKLAYKLGCVAAWLDSEA